MKNKFNYLTVLAVLIGCQFLTFYFFQKEFYAEQAYFVGLFLKRSIEPTGFDGFSALGLQVCIMSTWFLWSLVLFSNLETRKVRSAIEKYSNDYSLFVVFFVVEMVFRMKSKHAGIGWYILYMAFAYSAVTLMRNVCLKKRLSYN